MIRRILAQRSAIVVVCAVGVAPALAQDTQTRPMERQPSTAGVTGQPESQLKQNLEKLVGSWDVAIKVWSNPESSPEEAEGTATRMWVLNEHFIQEDFSSDATELMTMRYKMRHERPGSRPLTDPLDNQDDPLDRDAEDEDQPIGDDEDADQPGRIDPMDRDRLNEPPGSDVVGEFEGMGIFGFDREANKITHVWMDNVSGQSHLSLGTADPVSKAIAFDPVFLGTQRIQTEFPKIKLRIVSDTEHVLEYFDRGPDGGEMKVMEITYTKTGSAPTTTTIPSTRGR